MFRLPCEIIWDCNKRMSRIGDSWTLTKCRMGRGQLWAKITHSLSTLAGKMFRSLSDQDETSRRDCSISVEHAVMIRRSRFAALGVILMVFGGCSTVTDMVTSNLPESHSGRPSIVVRLREQEAYLYRGGQRTASSRISSGREGYRTPLVASTLFGRTKVIALISMVTTLMSRAASSRATSMSDAMRNRGIRT